jgi:hypothetical protein
MQKLVDHGSRVRPFANNTNNSGRSSAWDVKVVLGNGSLPACENPRSAVAPKRSANEANIVSGHDGSGCLRINYLAFRPYFSSPRCSKPTLGRP